jgi:hypothetical protein
VLTRSIRDRQFYTNERKEIENEKNIAVPHVNDCCVSNVINFHGIFSAPCREDGAAFKIITAVIGSKRASRY